MKKLIKLIIYLISILILVVLSILIVREYKLYELSKQIQSMSSSYNAKQKECEIIGNTTNYIYIERYDDKGNAIKNSKWEVTSQNGSFLGEFKTNEKGSGGLLGLDYGIYYLKEKEVPEGYSLDDSRYLFVISKADPSFSYIVSDQEKEMMFILSLKDSNGNPVNGIKYDIRDFQDELILTITTNKKGLAGVGNLQSGYYYIQEVETGERVHEFVIDENSEDKEQILERVDLIYDRK